MTFYATKGKPPSGHSKKRKKAKTNKKSYESDSSWSVESTSEESDSSYESDSLGEESENNYEEDYEEEEPVLKKKRRKSSNSSPRNPMIYSPREDEREGENTVEEVELSEELQEIAAALRREFKPTNSWVLAHVPICRNFGFYHNRFYRYDRKTFIHGILRSIIPSVHNSVENSTEEQKQKLIHLLTNCCEDVMKILQVVPMPPRQRRQKCYLPPYQDIPSLMDEVTKALAISEEQATMLSKKIETSKTHQTNIHRKLALLKSEMKTLDDAEIILLEKQNTRIFKNTTTTGSTYPFYILPKELRKKRKISPASSLEFEVNDAEKQDALDLLKRYLN